MKDIRKYAYCTTESQGKAPRIASQRVTFALLLALLMLLGVATFVLASDVSDAGYRGRITISNNSSDAANISATFDLNTQSLINTNKLNSSANDCAIQVAAGTDTAFMPSVNGSFPWATWVPAIGEDETLYQYLFTSGVTGGEIRYFPGEGGMTTADSPSLEPGANFTIEQKGYLNTSFSANKTLLDKPQGLMIFISDAENITAGIDYIVEWLPPTGFVDAGATWSDEAKAYDDNVSTYAAETVGATAWGNFLELTRPLRITETVRFNADFSAGKIETIDLDVYYSGGWHDVYQGAFVDETWTSKALGGSYPVSAARVRFYNDSGGAWGARLYEFDFAGTGFGAAVVAGNISSGEHTVRVSADTVNLTIYVDDVLEDTIALSGASVSDNTSGWTFLRNNVMPYMEHHKIWVDGVLQQHIEWEYDTIFTDLSGNSHDATPTFRTSASNANVSANLTSFTGIMDTTPPPAAGQTGWSILPSVPASPTGFFDEFNPESMTFWGSGYIAEFHTNTGIPLALIVFPYAFGLAIGFGFLAWYISSGGGKNKHGRGSLLAMAITTLIVMIYFVYGAGGVIPGWILLPFGIEVLVFIVWRQTPSPF